jgi:hypothetical protein
MIKEQIINHVINCSDYEIDDLAIFIAGMEAQKRAMRKKQYGIPERERERDLGTAARPGKSA